MRYIVIDPSGDYEDGKGHTGIAVLDDDDWDSLKTVTVKAKDFSTRHLYWQAVMDAVVASTVRKPHIAIIEAFMIRNNGFLIGKMPETIRLIGYLEFEMEEYGIAYMFQTPSQAKARFKDMDLVRCIPHMEFNPATHRYYLNGKVCSDHVRDALKHLLYYRRYKEKRP